ncbi:PIN domain-containing protein [Candidatus Poribacteria bacterium]|nr:PIN domain-containing protein [Candidatus Poribacteria bacterium]
MQIWGVRFVFIIASAVACYLPQTSISTGFVGFAIACILVAGEISLQVTQLRKIVACIIGLALGLIVSLGVYQLLPLSGPFFNPRDELWETISKFLIVIGIGYVGMICAYYISESPNVVRMFNSYRYTQTGTPFATNDANGFKILDTSVIIDGRILEICETQFIDGTLLIPRFVLNELQHIADSADILRKNKGRRGFDILRSLQNSPYIAVEIIEEDVPHLTEVDAKLVHFAQKHFAKILTNDLNLNKVAELQGVKVLNINELANAIRPIVVAGEIIQVHLQKIGKEPNQGVGYLDDGTMVIVEDGKDNIGQTLDVVVTQMLRTSTGQMIFARNSDSIDLEDHVG